MLIVLKTLPLYWASERPKVKEEIQAAGSISTHNVCISIYHRYKHFGGL